MFIIEIFRLFGSILVNSDEADKSLAKTDEHAEGVGNTLAKGIGTAAKWGIGLATAAGAGAAALLGLATKASATAAEIDDISQRTNMSSKSLQEWKYAAEQSGFSMETIEGSAKKLTKTMGSYADGNKATISAFKELGVSATDSSGKLRTTNDVFPEIIASLSDMTNITERDALSMAIFGKSAMDMGPMLNEGSDGIEAMKIKANELGLVMSNDSVAAGAKFDDMMSTVKASLSAMVTKVGTEVLPIAQSMLQWIMAHMPQIQAIASVAFNVISIAVKAVGDFINNTLIPAFNSFWAWLQPNTPIIQKTLEDAFKIIKTVIDDVSIAITAVIDWCIKYQNVLIPLVAGIAAAATTFGIYTLAIKAVTLAKTLWTNVTKIATVVGTGFNAVIAFMTSPIGLVVIAIGLLVAAGVLLYRNWDVVKAKATEIFGAIGKFIGGVVDGIKSGFKGMVNGVISGLNYMIRALNKLKFTVPDWVPLIGGKGFGFNLSQIPSYEIGTRYLPEDMLIQAHKGEMIVPKSENPYANSGNGPTLPSNGLVIKIENFVNNRAQDVKAFAEELEFYRKQANLGIGGAD